MKKFLKKLFALIANILPKKNIILFESQPDFADSSKSIFDECLCNDINRKYKMVWLVEKPENFKNADIFNTIFIKKNSKKLSDNIQKLYYFMVAKYCFYTHNLIGLPGNKRQIRYFIPHAALPLKNSSGCFWSYQSNTYIECTSNFAAKYRCKTFGGGEERVKILGLPRNDELFIVDDTKEKLGLLDYKKIIIWLPTFKHHKNKDRNDYNNNKISQDISLLNESDLKFTNNFLKKSNMILLIKFHPMQDLSFVKMKKYSNIRCISDNDLRRKNILLYRLLNVSDALITDFSSVYIDYLLLNRPIGFELIDIDKYKKGRGFLFKNPLKYMPGFKIHNKDELISFLEKISKGDDEFESERKKLLNLVHKYQDGKSSQRILKELNLIEK